MCRFAVVSPVLACLLFLTPAAVHAADEEAEARQVLQTAGVKSGLCVHLGCGGQQSPGLTAELAAAGRMLVHGIAPDDASLKRARTAIEARGVAGRATVEKAALDPLPYLRDLANLVVIEDFEALAARGLKREEVDRIVCPGGVVCIKTGSQWTRSVKPWPKEMDVWTHPNHGPDGNMVSADRVVRFPVGLRWQDGLPMNFNLWAACRGWVVAGGRCFTLSTTELENLGPASFVKPKQEEFLTARDAFNGLPLWKVNCGTTNEGKALNSRNTTPLVTDGRRVYAYKQDKLVGFDAATGAEAISYPVKYPSARLLLAAGVLVSSGWEAKEEAKDSGRDALWSHWVSKTVAGSVEAFDVATGSLKWSHPGPAVEIVAGDRLAYLLLQTGNPAKEQAVVAVDLVTGKPRWRVPHAKLGGDPDLHLNCAGPGVLVVARPKAKAISILAAADGKTLWEIKDTGSFWTPVVDGLLWHGNKKYDLKTGQLKGTLPAGIDSGICTPSSVVGDYVTVSRGGDYLEFVPAEEKKPGAAKRIHYGALRGACIEGTTPAYGMFYTGQNFCRCTPGQVPGFVAFGPTGDPPAKADFEGPRPIEEGPAYGKKDSADASSGAWPTLRGNAQRSGASSSTVSEKLKSLWQADAAQPAEGPLADAWKARLVPCLSAPVASGGLVCAAAVDAGQIVALDAATGKPAWRFTAGGRIDSPPTLYAGLCLFGCHDGWVYALRAKDGQLAWRVRAAPQERRMVAFGQVESVWPAIGSVLVHDGVAYVTAGRTTESDGGVAVLALDPATGRQFWAKQIGPGPARQNDILVLRDGRLLVHHVALDPKTGQIAPDPKPDNQAGLEGIIDGSWTRLGTRRSGNTTLGRAVGETLAWNDALVLGYQSGPRSCFAMPKSKTAGKEKLVPADYAWRLPMPPDHQVEAMALSANSLVAAGRVCDPKSEKVAGFLWIISLDGKRLSEYPLDAPAVYDGLAVAGQQVYVSLQNGRIACLK